MTVASYAMRDCSMQRPDFDARIIVFDGICHVCSGWVNSLNDIESIHHFS